MDERVPHAAEQWRAPGDGDQAPHGHGADPDHDGAGPDHDGDDPGEVVPDDDARDVAGGRRSWLRVALTVAAGVLVWFALAIPGDLPRVGPPGVMGVPVEALAVAALAVLLPPRPLRVVAVVLGVLLGLLVVIKGFDIGFTAIFDRRFDVLGDWYFLGPAVGVLSDSAGRAVAVLAVVAAVAGTLAVLSVLPLAMMAVTASLSRHRRATVPVLAVLTLGWVGCALAGVTIAPGVPAASANTSPLVWSTVGQVRSDLADRHTFAGQIAGDEYASVPGDGLLTALRGKDVLLVFVESYGRVALSVPEMSRIVRPALADAQQQLTAAGVRARSAFLVSPTFGGASWLAHSTVQSGLWVDSQQRYEQLLGDQRLTLTRAFGRAGWRTVTDIPEMTGPWPQGRPFYGFDTLLTANDLGYRGPRYGYALMPDQFILDSFRQRELPPGQDRPVMAEIDLLSSHSPWVAPPPLVPWPSVGDGAIYRQPAGAGVAGAADADVRTRYARTLAYSLRALASFAATSDPDLVILAMGDHQPATTVSGTDASHQVPVMLITADQGVLDRVTGWGWTPGLQPASDAPVWRMDALRDRILSTFGPDEGR